MSTAERHRPVKDIWRWTTECWECGHQTPVVWPRTGTLNQNKVGETLARSRLGNVGRTYSNTRDKMVYGNLCVHCHAYQGNHYIGQELLSMAAVEQSYDAVIERGAAELVGKILLEIDCTECGRPVTNPADPHYLCEVCAMAGESTDPEICERCGRYGEPGSFDNHHTSYRNDETILVCKSCHGEIHSSKTDDELVPEVSRAEAKERGWI